MKRAILLLFLYLSACCAADAQAQRPARVGARDNITGHYVLRYSNVSGSLDILLLSNNKIKFSLVALLKTGGGGTRNGTAEGTVALSNGTAIYRNGECSIYMKFLNNRIEVRESNTEDCGFGAFVTAQGTYLRKSREPRFDQ